MRDATKIGISLGLAALLAIMAIVNSGCASDDEVIPPDEPTDPVEPVEPTVEPPAMEEPAPICGTEVYAIPSSELPAKFPLEMGYPFCPLGCGPGAVIASVYVVDNGVNDRIDMKLSYGPENEWTGVIGFGWNRPDEGFATLTIDDVIVHDGFVAIVWTRSFYGNPNPEIPDWPWQYDNHTMLSVVDVQQEWIGLPTFLSGEPYKNYRIAWDGARYHVAQYDVFPQTLRRATVSVGLVGPWENIVDLGFDSFLEFHSVAVDADGTFRVYFHFANDPESAIRVDHRSCQ